MNFQFQNTQISTLTLRSSDRLVRRRHNISDGFPGGSEVKNPPANAGDMDLFPGSGRSPGRGHDNPLQ